MLDRGDHKKLNLGSTHPYLQMLDLGGSDWQWQNTTMQYNVTARPFHPSLILAYMTQSHEELYTGSLQLFSQTLN